MTPEEAKAYMQLYKLRLQGSVGDLSSDIEAFDMAIKALDVVAGTVVDEKQSDRELFESICEKYGINPNNDGQGLRVVMEDGQVKPLTEELIHDTPFVTGLSTDPDNPVPESKNMERLQHLRA